VGASFIPTVPPSFTRLRLGKCQRYRKNPSSRGVFRA